MLTTNTLTLAQARKAMNANFFWLEALANGSHSGDLNLALSKLKTTMSDDMDRCYPTYNDEVVDHDVNAAQLSFYTQLLVREQIRKELFSKGVLDAHNPDTVRYWIDAVSFHKIPSIGCFSSTWELSILRKTPKTLDELQLLIEVLEANVPARLSAINPCMPDFKFEV